MTRRDWLALALVALVGALGWRAQLLSPVPLGDEEPYVCAARALAESRALATCPRYLYSPGLARAAAWIWSQGGDLALFACSRGLVWWGAAGTLWLSVSGLGGPFWARVGLASSLMLLWPPVTQSITLGNLSATVAGLTAAALMWRRTHAGLAGALLGSAIALKPLSAAAPLVLLVHAAANARRARRWSWPELAIGGVAIAVALGLAAWGGGFAALPSSKPEASNAITIVRLVRELGGDVSGLTCFVAVVLGGAALAACPRFSDARLLNGLTLVTSLLSAPLVWNHSFTLVTPLVVIAVAQAIAGYRAAARGEARKRALLGVLGCVLATLTIAFSDAFGIVAAEVPYGAVLIALPLFAPAGLLAFLASSKARAPQDDAHEARSS